MSNQTSATAQVTLLRMRYAAFLLAFFAVLFWQPHLAYADTYLVTTVDDSGPGSLRQAILDANAGAGHDVISFALTGGGVPTIQPITPLPAITDTVEIDARGNQGCASFPSQPQVVLDGSLAGANADGLQLHANHSRVIGLYITGFAQDGIDILASHTIVACNVIGLNALGVDAGNGQHGVRLGAGAQSNLIGDDIVLFGYPNSVTGNVIAGNGGDGIRLEGSTTSRNSVIGNVIGVTAVGDQARPNAGAGIRLIDASHTDLGSIGVSNKGNRIAYNGQGGIVLTGTATANQIEGNLIYSNTGLGIDLGADGVTLNDLGDGDSGANERQNFPVISEAYLVGDITVVRGSINSAVTSRFDIEIFANPSCDPSGFGEGAELLGRYSIDSSDSNGNGQFTFILDHAVPVGYQLTATADFIDLAEIKPLQSSEFSACKAVDAVPPSTASLPIARHDSATTAEDNAITLNVLTNDTDPNNDPLTIVAVGNLNSGTAQIVNNQILYTPAANFNGDVTFFYSINDGNIHNTMQANVRVTVTPINDPPGDLTLASGGISENLPANTPLGTLGAADVDDSGFFNFSLVGLGNDNALFQIVGNQLFTRTSLDFESKASHRLRIGVTDRSGASFEKEFTVLVFNDNDAPTLINLSNNRVNENQAGGLTVGSLTSLDPDANNTHTYALVGGAGSNDIALFRLEGATLKTNSLLDYEAKTVYSLRIRSSDQNGASYEQVFAIYLNNLASPPDAIHNPLSSCSGDPIVLIDANANDAPRRVLVKIEGIAISNKTETTCTVTGRMTILSNGNTLNNLAFSGDVNSRNQFSTSTIPEFTLNVAGLALQASAVQVEYYLERPSLRITRPLLKMPAEWGGLAAPLSLSAVIDNSGVKLGTGTVNLPTISTQSGFELGLSGSLVPVAGGYQINADGELTIPNIGKKKTPGGQGQSCTISAGVTIYAGAQGQTVMVIAAGSEQVTVASSQAPFAADALRLDKIRAGFSCDQGIPIGQTGLFLTGLSGEITLTPNNEGVSVQVQIVAGKKLPVLGPVIGLNGTMDLKVRPEFKLDLGVALRILSFEMANARASMTTSSFSTTINITSVFVHGRASINAWSADNKFHFTGSGRMSIEVIRGSLSNSCTHLPCGVRTCWSWGIPYPCGIRYCYTCISFPPFNTGRLAEVGVDAGEFTNGRYGFKGYVNVLGSTVGFYVDERGNLSFGNVEHYRLIAGPSVAAAHQAWLQSLKTDMSVNAAAFAPYTFLADSAGGGVLIHTPLVKPALDLSQVQVAQASDVISKVNLIAHADVGFTLKARGPLGFSLITPQGLEVTPANYNQSQTLGYLIAYTQSVGYEPEDNQERAGDLSLPTLRFTPLVPGAAVNGVDVKIDDATVFGNVNFTLPEAVKPVALTPGTHSVTLVKSGTNEVVLSTSLTLITATDYSLLTVQNQQTGADELVTLVDDNQAPVSFGMAKVRFFNAAASTLDMLVNGTPLFSDIAHKAASSYALMAAGTITVEMRNSNNNTLVSQPQVVQLVEGGIYTFFSADYLVGGSPVAVLQRQDASYVRSYLSEYAIDQAQMGGEWQIKLVGDTDNTHYLLSVAGPASPPVLASVTVDASNPAAAQVGWRLTSDLQPTQVTLYINPGPISQSLSITGANGNVSMQEIPLFVGYPVAEFGISNLAQLGGQLVSQQVDLSKLASGTYHLWVRANDGVNPPVSSYAAAPTVVASAVQDEYGFNSVRVAKEGYDPLLHLADAAAITIDHSADFPTTWNAPISTTLDSATDALYIEWSAHPHPDVDNYRLYVGNTPLNPTQVITTGGAVVEYDANGLAGGATVGFTTLEDLQPGVQYYIAIEAVDTESGRHVRSPEVTFTASPGIYTLTAAQTSYVIAKGGQIAIPVTLREIQPLFYPQVGLALDLGATPVGLTASFQDDVEGNSVLSSAQPTVTLQVAVDAAVADGRYPIKVLSYNGANQQAVTLEIVVGDAPVQVYLPLVAR